MPCLQCGRRNERRRQEPTRVHAVGCRNWESDCNAREVQGHSGRGPEVIFSPYGPSEKKTRHRILIRKRQDFLGCAKLQRRSAGPPFPGTTGPVTKTANVQRVRSLVTARSTTPHRVLAHYSPTLKPWSFLPRKPPVVCLTPQSGRQILSLGRAASFGASPPFGMSKRTGHRQMDGKAAVIARQGCGRHGGPPTDLGTPA